MAYNIGKTCKVCGKYQSFEVDAADYSLWRSGVPIEHAFPYLTGMQRDLLLTAICCVCPPPHTKE